MARGMSQVAGAAVDDYCSAPGRRGAVLKTEPEPQISPCQRYNPLGRIRFSWHDKPATASKSPYQDWRRILVYLPVRVAIAAPITKPAACAIAGSVDASTGNIRMANVAAVALFKI